MVNLTKIKYCDSQLLSSYNERVHVCVCVWEREWERERGALEYDLHAIWLSCYPLRVLLLCFCTLLRTDSFVEVFGSPIGVRWLNPFTPPPHPPLLRRRILLTVWHSMKINYWCTHLLLYQNWKGCGLTQWLGLIFIKNSFSCHSLYTVAK